MSDVEHAFPRGPYSLDDLTWQEWTTIRRLRCELTKAMLAKACGVGRTTLWRVIECPRDDPKWLPLSEELMAKVEAALDEAEARRTVTRVA